MSAYIHGYDPLEQARLVEQAAFLNDRLIRPGTRFRPGTELLEIGCGVGAVLGQLGQAYPGLRLHGIDFEPKQVASARRHLRALGLKADLRQADALRLPFESGRFDAAWMMWFLEHVGDPLAALQEARRVLRPGGFLTAIEVDYHTLQPVRGTPGVAHFLRCFCDLFNLGGRSDTGSQVAGWMRAAGFKPVRVIEIPFEFLDEAGIEYLLAFMEPTFDQMLELPQADPALLRQGLRDFRALGPRRGAGIVGRVHKAWAWKPAK